MTNPISGKPNVSLNFTIPVASSICTPKPQFTIDSLQMAHIANRGFSLSSFFESIARCFKRLFGIKTVSTSNLTDSIARVAARDHFVWFYKKEENQLTAFLGNFHPCPISLWGRRFKCAEAAFQAAKFSSVPPFMNQFENLDGEEAFKLGRSLSRNWSQTQQAQWRHNNLAAMRQVLTAKFTQNPDLKALLLATGDAYLVEHTPRKGRDVYWGDDFDGTGRNMLGQILMEIRCSLGGAGVVPRNQQYNQFLLHP